MSEDLLEDIVETATDIGAAVADGRIEPGEIVDVLADVAKILGRIKFKRSRSRLLKAAIRHERRAAELRRKARQAED